MRVAKIFAIFLFIAAIVFLVLAEENRVFGTDLDDWLSWDGLMFTFLPIGIGVVYIFLGLFNSDDQRDGDDDEMGNDK